MMTRIKHKARIESITFVPNMVDTRTENSIDFASMFYKLVEPALHDWPSVIHLKMEILPSYSPEVGGASAEYELSVDGVEGTMRARGMHADPPAAGAQALQEIEPFATFMAEVGPRIHMIAPDHLKTVCERNGIQAITQLAVHPEKIPDVLSEIRAITAWPAPPMPLAPTTLPPPLPQQPPEIDSNGQMWDRRIHAAGRKKNKDGSWRKKRVMNLNPTKEQVLHKRGYITVEETCEMLGISHHVQIQHIRRQNELFPKPEYIHGYSGYRRKDIKAWIELFGKPGENQ